MPHSSEIARRGARALIAGLSAFAFAAPAFAQPLAGAPEGRGFPQGAPAKECWAQVREPARFGPPPTGPEYVWTRAPAPPGAPGPVWCLTVVPPSGAPVMVQAERLGWIQVVCPPQAPTPRMAPRMAPPPPAFGRPPPIAYARTPFPPPTYEGRYLWWPGKSRYWVAAGPPW